MASWPVRASGRSQATRSAAIAVVTSQAEFSGGESAQAAVFGVADAVLDAGVGSVAGFQKCQLPGLVLVVNAW